MKYYIQVVGPCDTTFIGPFETHDDATSYMRTVPAHFDTYLLHDDALRANIEQYGPLDLQKP